MAKLREEYTDIRNRTHKVEHVVLSTDQAARERVVEELIRVLTETDGGPSA